MWLEEAQNLNITFCYVIEVRVHHYIQVTLVLYPLQKKCIGPQKQSKHGGSCYSTFVPLKILDMALQSMPTAYYA